MLVQHDIEAEFVGELPFIVITVEQLRRVNRIQFAIGQIHPQRTVMVVPDVGIRLLGKLENSHLFLPSDRRSRMWCATALGCSRCGKCPALSITAKRALGSAAAKLRPYSGATMRSALPHSTSAGIPIRCSRAFSFGLCM